MKNSEKNSMSGRNFDVIVVGAGHAGSEASLACARLGKKTIVFAGNLETVAYLACNPSIGGTAKGNIVKEIDALGGEMAVNADKSLLQLRMLNQGKGPAVHSPRAQVDKHRYHSEMKKVLENTENLYLRQAEVTEIFCEGEKAAGVRLSNGLEFFAPCVIVAAGVYLNSKITVGNLEKECGPNGFASSKELTKSLEELGFKTRRFKTGTPARINSRSVDFSKLEKQQADLELPPLSYINNQKPSAQADCYLTWSTKKTHEIILENIKSAPIFSGKMKSTGARYCPSIEDKVVRFADKERHQIFLEPESLDTNEIYVQGVSSSMPADIQEKIYRSIPGLENAEIMRDAYAIEYDCIDSTELFPSLMSKRKKGLFFAGQINGTSGYEEAAAQGLIAGINAVRFLDGDSSFVLDRSSSYIGVLIDDLTTKGTEEPYRMMTGRAEYRLLLRQDNADTRLTEAGYGVGLVSEQRYRIYTEKKREIEQLRKLLNEFKKPKEVEELFAEKGENLPLTGIKLADALKRKEIGIYDLKKHFKELDDFSAQALEECETDIKYEGYIERQKEQVEQFLKMESKLLPSDIDYNSLNGLRLEARQKLDKIRPLNLGQASRISGVSPADIAVLIVYLALESKKNK